jgi:Domain of unknown function DUF11/Beta-propeller repeat
MASLVRNFSLLLVTVAFCLLPQAQGTTPFSFEANLGQTNAHVKYLARGHGYTLFLTAKEAVLVGRGKPNSAGNPVLRLRLLGANPSPAIEGLNELPAKSNYLIGRDPENWQTNVPHYGSVKFRDIRPGVDLVYYGNAQQLEYDLVVSPQADPQQLVFEFDGVTDINIDRDGRLRLETVAGVLWQQAPLAYQVMDGNKRTISARYVLRDKNHVGFVLGDYDRSKTVVIDPVLGYSTYVGGSDSLDFAGDPRLAFSRAIASVTDKSGNTYIAGLTDAIDFPSTSGEDITFVSGGCFDSEALEPCDDFVAKFDPSGALIYSTFLGPSSTSLALPTTRGLAVDHLGQAYVVGFVLFDIELSPSFINKLNASGTAVLYEHKGFDVVDCYPQAIAVDSDEQIYVVGNTDSGQLCPATPGVFQPNPAQIFLAKFDTRQPGVYSGRETLVYLTYLGSGTGLAVEVDEAKNVYVAGTTRSSGFPKTASFGTNDPRINSAFVMKLNPTATKLIFSTLIRSSMARAIAIDPAHNVYITGSAVSTGFPLSSSAFKKTYGGGDSDAFVSKLSSGGGTLLYSTYLGGSNEDNGTDIAVDSSGRAYVGGYTRSSNFPVSSNAVQKTFGGGTCTGRPCADAFVTTLNATGSGIAFYSTFLGGKASEFGNGLGLDRALNIYIAGETYSSNFPTRKAYQSQREGLSDAFLSKLVIAGDLALTNTPSGASVPGSNVTFTIKALNNGPDTSDLPVLTTAVPNSFVSAKISSGSCTTPAAGGTGTVTCRRTSMTRGAPWTLSLVVRAQGTSSITNTARISAKTQDQVASNNSATATVP